MGGKCRSLASGANLADFREAQSPHRKTMPTSSRLFISALLSVASSTLAFAQGTTKAATPTPSVAARLDATEIRIVKAVDPKNAEGLALLEKLVNINSGTMNFAGVREVAGILRGELDKLGFETRWVDGAAFGRAGHLIAERTGKGPRLLLIGHLDT